MSKFPTERLKKWFLENRRELPWRTNPSPYRVWISEIMLQQTQVATVIPYFERWMATFPTLEVLAKACQEQVLKCWEGLGYYSRARHLHAAAIQIMDKFGGEIPSTREELAQIKGIGLYTQGAIRSFAFHQKAAAVDGNVLRLLSRFLAIEEEIDKAVVKAKLQDYAEEILPEHEPWLVSEGLIELGATVCGKKAQCALCPLKGECLSFRHQMQDRLPLRKPRPKTIYLKRLVAVIFCQGEVLVQKGEAGQVMADLFQFPYIEEHFVSNEKIAEVFGAILGLNLSYVKPLSLQTHSFTKYHAQLFPHLLSATEKKQGLWVKKEKLKEFPFSSGHKRILSDITL